MPPFPAGKVVFSNCVYILKSATIEHVITPVIFNISTCCGLYNQLGITVSPDKQPPGKESAEKPTPPSSGSRDLDATLENIEVRMCLVNM